MPFESMTPELASELLAKAGLAVAPSAIRIERREERWLARLPGERVAWVAASAEGLARLRSERRVLRLLEARCTILAPRVLFESAGGDLDVRKMVPGNADPWRCYAEVKRSSALSIALGEAIGEILAEQHTCIHAQHVADWLPARPSWPEPRAWILERLPRVVEDRELLARAVAVIDVYEGTVVAEDDRVLVHTDVGLHNLGIDLDTHVVHGIFDYEGAAWADRHHDFRYLVLDLDREDLFDAAVRVYEPRVGRHIDRDRVRLYNAACAVGFLAYRAGTAPGERSCGRTLAEDLRWSSRAIARALGE